jgi:hypothetical protein
MKGDKINNLHKIVSLIANITYNIHHFQHGLKIILRLFVVIVRIEHFFNLTMITLHLVMKSFRMKTMMLSQVLIFYLMLNRIVTIILKINIRIHVKFRGR